MTLIRWEKHELGRRCFIGKNKRIHHGFSGCVLILIGIILAADDIKDIKLWFKFS